MKASIEERFEQLHKEKPEIYAEFKRVIFNLMERGFTRWSADGVFHIVRFTTKASMEDIDKTYKINNNYVCLYARMFAKEYPQHKEFFRFKPLKKAA